VGEDTSEFADFYRQTYSLVLTTCERRLGDRSTAEDVASEVFRVAWQRWRDGEELSVPWVYGVVRNVIGNEYRRSGRADALWVKMALEPDAPEDEEQNRRVRDAMLALREKDRELLFMAYWEELSGSEMAAILGITASALWVRLNRARAALKKVLGEHDDQEGGRHG
jgi:RNA polymerase sigma factor (sigma-70 family)